MGKYAVLLVVSIIITGFVKESTQLSNIKDEDLTWSAIRLLLNEQRMNALDTEASFLERSNGDASARVPRAAYHHDKNNNSFDPHSPGHFTLVEIANKKGKTFRYGSDSDEEAEVGSADYPDDSDDDDDANTSRLTEETRDSSDHENGDSRTKTRTVGHNETVGVDQSKGQNLGSNIGIVIGIALAVLIIIGIIIGIIIARKKCCSKKRDNDNMATGEEGSPLTVSPTSCSRNETINGKKHAQFGKGDVESQQNMV